ncbi:MAG TPA: sialidase family protein, partial [candidate division Zixibacteria bacterium]|nr:sialidase family protein [candidate division Zixibacteria bacterium]
MKAGLLLVLVAVVVAAAGSALAADPPIPANYPISSPYYELQNEEQIWISPLDSTRVVAVWRDFRLGYRQVAIGIAFGSPDFWVDWLIPPTQQVGEQQSDPTLTVDRNGTFYISVLDYVPAYQFTDSSFISFLKSTDNGMTWSGPVTVEGTSGPYFEDKQFITVDRTTGPHSGNVYAAWARFPNPTRIMFARSTDGAAGFDPPVIVGQPWDFTDCGWADVDAGQFANPLVGADGSVYVFWIGVWADPDCNFSYALHCVKSTDGGATFGPPQFIRTTFGNWGQVDGFVDVYNQPVVAADLSAFPHGGNLYVAYANMDTVGSFFDYEIDFLRSLDGGATWSEPIRINDGLGGDTDSTDQFHPWLVINDEGTLACIWYDQRTDPANHYLFDVYAAYSFDGGASFTRNHRVSEVSINPSSLKKSDRDRPGPDAPAPVAKSALAPMAGLIAEYIGVSIRNNYLHAAWTDTRNGNQDVYGANWEIPFLAPRLISPPDSAVALGPTDDTVALRWSTCWRENDDHYTVQIAADAGFSTILAVLDVSAADTVVDAAAFPALSAYHWRVRAHRYALGDATDWSDGRVVRRAATCCVLRGDFNDDGAVKVSDLTALINYLFRGGPAPACAEHGDAN